MRFCHAMRGITFLFYVPRVVRIPTRGTNPNLLFSMVRGATRGVSYHAWHIKSEFDATRGIKFSFHVPRVVKAPRVAHRT